MKSRTAFVAWIAIITTLMLNPRLVADEIATHAGDAAWVYDSGLMQPFWLGDTVDGESVLFLKDPATGEAKAQLLFPVLDILHVTRAVDWRVPGGMTFEAGRDYLVKAGSREITLPKDSRIPSFTPDQLRRPAGSQKHKLTATATARSCLPQGLSTMKCRSASAIDMPVSHGHPPQRSTRMPCRRRFRS